MSTSKIFPLKDRVLVKPIEEDITSAAGIVIPDTADKARPQQGEVIASGPDSKIAVGDTVLFTKYGPTEVKVDGEEYLIVQDDDVLAAIGRDAKTG